MKRDVPLLWARIIAVVITVGALLTYAATHPPGTNLAAQIWAVVALYFAGMATVGLWRRDE
jgi:hypothetical protein